MAQKHRYLWFQPGMDADHPIIVYDSGEEEEQNDLAKEVSLSLITCFLTCVLLLA